MDEAHLSVWAVAQSISKSAINIRCSEVGNLITVVEFDLKIRIAPKKLVQIGQYHTVGVKRRDGDSDLPAHLLRSEVVRGFGNPVKCFCQFFGEYASCFGQRDCSVEPIE